jgi:DNA repair protein RadC
MKPLTIKQMNKTDRPREKLAALGTSAMTDAELLAILLRTGNRDLSAIGLAQHVLSSCGSTLAAMGRKSIEELTRIKGIGPAKALEIVAALELGKRRFAEDNQKTEAIRSSKDAFYYLGPKLMDLKTEEFWVMLCNRANIPMEMVRISSGGIHGTVVDIKVVLRIALEKGACSMILAHNHPSGGLIPSEEDKKLTQRLSESARMMDIKVLDHLIIAGNKFFSFMDEGLL